MLDINLFAINHFEDINVHLFTYKPNMFILSYFSFLKLVIHVQGQLVKKQSPIEMIWT